MMSRPIPANVPLPTKIGKSLSFDVLVAARAEPVEGATAGKILELEKAGKLDYVNRLQLATLEEMPAFVQFGELKARMSGRTATNVSVLPIYNDINLGSVLQVTGRVAEDGSILAQIHFEQSFLDGGEEGAFNPQDQSPPKAIARQLTQTTVRLKPGEPLMIGGHQAGVGEEASQSWIVVVGRVGD